MSHLDDKELIEMYNFGNPDYAFNLIMRKYQKNIYWHVRRLLIDHEDSNDVVQNVFLKVWESLKNFRGDSKLYTWLYRIATNEALSFLKKKQRRFYIPIVNIESKLADKLESDPYFDGNEIQRKLQKAILKLPEKQKLVFNLRYFDEMKYEDISEITGVSVGALKASYHIALKKIEKILIN